MGIKYRWPVLAAVLVVSISGVVSAGSKWLVTPEEAAKVRMPEGDFKELVAAVEGPGPAIVVQNPKALQRLNSPVNIVVSFEPGTSGLPPNMGTLKVTLIGFFDIDLTDRVREYVEGTRLNVEEADLPTGKHRIRMAIRDTTGNPNERDVIVQVVD